MTKKALVCVPRAGVPTFGGAPVEATAARDLKARGYEIETVHFTPRWLRQQEDACRIKHRSLYFLAALLRVMSTVDAVYFSPDWATHRSLRILHRAARDYGLEIIEEDA